MKRKSKSVHEAMMDIKEKYNNRKPNNSDEELEYLLYLSYNNPNEDYEKENSINKRSNEEM